MSRGDRKKDVCMDDVDRRDFLKTLAEAKAERILAQELMRAKWKEKDLEERRKNDVVKLAIAARLRRETTLTIREIARRLHMGSWKSLNNKLYLAGKARDKVNDALK